MTSRLGLDIRTFHEEGSAASVTGCPEGMRNLHPQRYQDSSRQNHDWLDLALTTILLWAGADDQLMLLWFCVAFRKDKTTTEIAKKVFHSCSLWERCYHPILGMIFKTGFKPKCQKEKVLAKSHLLKSHCTSQEF